MIEEDLGAQATPEQTGPSLMGTVPPCLSWVSRWGEAMNQVQGLSRESGQEQPETDAPTVYVHQELKAS